MSYPIGAMRARPTKFFRDFDHPWLKGVAFRDVVAEDLLKKNLRGSALGAAKKRAWVFDLDSTLFNVGPRIQNIFFEFVRQHPRPHESWSRLLGVNRPELQQYDIAATFRELFVLLGFENAAERGKKLWEEFLPFWEQHFFTDRHMHHDAPYAGSVDFVKRVHEAGREVIYLTGRDRPRSGQGTLHALKTAGFPWGEGTHLFMKSDRDEGDLHYKRRACSVLDARFDVSVLIDNEPENLVMFAEQFEHAQIVLFHSVMSARMPQGNFAHALGEREPLRLLSYERLGE